MKAVATLRTWKKAENPTAFVKYVVKEEKRVEFEAENLSKAQLWLYDMFPASWLVGFNLQMENKDFTCQAVPEYWMGILGKEATPRNIVKELRKQVIRQIMNDEAAKRGLKEWVEDPYSGERYLVDVK